MRTVRVYGMDPRARLSPVRHQEVAKSTFCGDAKGAKGGVGGDLYEEMHHDERPKAEHPPICLFRE